jgi:hypothetical protein
MPTILKTKNSVTTTVVPTTLQQGELAVNITDKKMWVGNAATTPVQILGAGTTGTAAGSNTQVQYNSSGTLAGDADFTFNGTTVTMANDARINGLTIGQGNTSGLNTTALGESALAVNTGGGNIAVGKNALVLNTSGALNVAIGAGYGGGTATSMGANTTGSYNTAVGSGSLAANTTASNNTTVGYQAGYANTTGSEIVGIGYQALFNNTTGISNVGVGYRANFANQTGSNNTAVGLNALNANTASANSAFGQSALTSNTTGTENQAFGQNAVGSNTTGSANSGFGQATLIANTTGGNNTAIGYRSLFSNTTASNNTAVGYQAGYANTVSANNTYIGYQAGYNAQSGASESNNTFVGRLAGYSVTTGVSNTFYGQSAGYDMTTGSRNTIVGTYNGNQYGLDIRTASDYIVLSTGAGVPCISTGTSRTLALEGVTPKAGTGISFSPTQFASSDANTLDDYEEGTWTPTAYGATTAGTTTYNNQLGTYTKIGRLVTVTCLIDYSAMTGTGQLVLAGLPFTIGFYSQNYPVGSILVSGLNWGGGTMIQPLGYENTTTMRLYYMADDGSANIQACVNEAADMRITMTYSV